MTAVCALDVGTTRIKAMTLAEDLTPGPVVSAPSVLSAPRAGAVEVDADELWTQVLAVLRQVAAAGSEIAGIVIANQRATVFLVDQDGRPLAPGLSWQDSRAAPELAAWMARVGAERFARVTGLVPSTLWSLAKILRWRDRGLPPGARFATVQDWLLHRLGAPDWVLDHADASLTGLLDTHSLDWAADLVGAAGLAPQQLPSLAASGWPVGALGADVSAATGLRAGTPLVLGGADQQCATLGAGVLEPGDAAVNLGTAGVVNVATDRLAIDPEGRLVCTVHVVPGRWVLEGLENTYGGAHRWGREVLGDDLDGLAAAAPVGSRGLLCFPYLAGSGAPDYDSTARGAFLGLALAHGRAEMARAILEGTSLELARILDAARDAVPIRRVVASGGGARSRLQLEMLANLAGVPVAVAPHVEATLVGAGILGWVGLGHRADVAAAARALPPSVEAVAPGPRQRDAYRGLYLRYQASLARLRQVRGLSTGLSAGEGGWDG